MTFEFWLQLSTPLVQGATLLSARERPAADGAPGREALRIWLLPATGDAVLEVCAQGRAEPLQLRLPGVGMAGPQHLAVSFERRASAGSWAYAIAVHRNCEPLLLST
eukprot:1071221-Lingulodinium_polyedra.AAC.1